MAQLIRAMLRVSQQRHLMFFNQDRNYQCKYNMILTKPESRSSAEQQTPVQFQNFTFQLRAQMPIKWRWESVHFDIELIQAPNILPSVPLSLDNYLELYKDPRILTFKIRPNHTMNMHEQADMIGQEAGSLFIEAAIRQDYFRLPIQLIESQSIYTAVPKRVCIFGDANAPQSPLLSGTLRDYCIYEQVTGFNSKGGCKMWTYEYDEKVEARHIVVAWGSFKIEEVTYSDVPIKIASTRQKVDFLEPLLDFFQQLKHVLMGVIEPVIIIQHAPTDIQDAHRMVFHRDLGSLWARLYRSCLYDKVKDLWLIQGMVNYTRRNKHFQDIVKQLIQLVSQGEEIVPISDDSFPFDRVWQVKSIFFYHVLSNFKAIRDYGSSSLASLIIEESRKSKVTSQGLFKRLKNKYGLKNFRTIYEQQFVRSTGINRIFYQMIDLKRQNKVKIIVRQKALTNRLFRLYNMFRIKLQQEYDMLTPLTQRVIAKNKFSDNRKKELSGSLAVPKRLNCLPYFRGQVAVETDASEMPFELELKEENIVEEKQNVTSKVRAPVRKMGETEKSYEGFGWMMVDAAHVFPAVYKNENVQQAVLLEKIRRRYDSQHEELKVLNCVSSRDHAGSQKICKALLQKIRIKPNQKENTSISVKRKILQLLPLFLSKANDYHIWEQMQGFLKLYEPVCHDHSEQGWLFMLSLIEAVGEIDYNREFSYYFQLYHQSLLKILSFSAGRSPDKELKLKAVLYPSMMKWTSRHSLKIMEAIAYELEICQNHIAANVQILVPILKHVLSYMQVLNLPHHPTIIQIQKYIKYITTHDPTNQLFSLELAHTLQRLQKQMPPLQFFKKAISMIEDVRAVSKKRWGWALFALKGVLQRNKKMWGLQIQLSLSENQSYFLADYLWNQMCSKQAKEDDFVRVQLIKIYRIFYFYHIPIVTLVKLRKNHQTNEFPWLRQDQSADLLTNLRGFFPDIKWFSGYDSRSAKQLKAKYQQMNENKRKKKNEEYSFTQNNAITNYIKQHPGREGWDEIGRQALRIFISIYEDKEQHCDGSEAQRHKNIQEGFKRIEQKLKRGKMPEYYNYDELKNEVELLMDEFNERQQRIRDIFLMVDEALAQINEQKERKEAELRDEMRIVISLENIREAAEEQQEEQPPPREEGDDQFLFDDGEPERGVKVEAEDDIDMMQLEPRQEDDHDLVMMDN